MKKLIIFIMVLAACSPGGSSSNAVNCSAGKEVCITIDKVQPFTMGQPMLLNINVSSTKDFSDLNVSLITHGGITVEGPKSWENFLTTSVNEPGMAFWNFAIKAGQTLTFKRVLRFQPEEGYYSVFVEVVNTGRIIDASESLNILLEHQGVTIARNDTPLPPHTSNITEAAYGPGTPAPTDVPNFQTLIATRNPQTTPTQFSPLVATSTPQTSPYPPPPSSTPVSSPYP